VSEVACNLCSMVNKHEEALHLAPQSDAERLTQDAVYAQTMLERARAVVEHYQDARDASIRAAAAAGAERTAIARAVGISRRMVYVAIDVPSDDDDERREWFLRKAEDAFIDWDAAGRVGHPDDYWAL
jgi:hypothetical protein